VPRLSDPKIDPDDYLAEAVKAFCLLCDGRGPRDALLFEVFSRLTLIVVDAADLRVSDLDRLHTLFNTAVDATSSPDQGSPGGPAA
jgi:hypothetical protein